MEQFGDEKLNDKRNRAWVFTINNYTVDDTEAVHALGDKAAYVSVGREVGDQGTRHYQGFVMFETLKAFKQVKALLVRAWIAPKAKLSTFNQAIGYTQKDNTFYECGTRPIDAVVKGEQNRERAARNLQAVMEAIRRIRRPWRLVLPAAAASQVQQIRRGQAIMHQEAINCTTMQKSEWIGTDLQQQHQTMLSNKKTTTTSTATAARIEELERELTQLKRRDKLVAQIEDLDVRCLAARDTAAAAEQKFDAWMLEHAAAGGGDSDPESHKAQMWEKAVEYFRVKQSFADEHEALLEERRKAKRAIGEDCPCQQYDEYRGEYDYKIEPTAELQDAYGTCGGRWYEYCRLCERVDVNSPPLFALGITLYEHNKK